MMLSEGFFKFRKAICVANIVYSFIMGSINFYMLNYRRVGHVFAFGLINVVLYYMFEWQECKM